MTNQTNEAAERSAHVTRGEKPAPAKWPVVRMPDGTWKLKSVVALEARIAELEAALQDIASGRYSNVLLPTHPPQDPDVVRARAALEGEKE